MKCVTPALNILPGLLGSAPPPPPLPPPPVTGLLLEQMLLSLLQLSLPPPWPESPAELPLFFAFCRDWRRSEDEAEPLKVEDDTSCGVVDDRS